MITSKAPRHRRYCRHRFALLLAAASALALTACGGGGGGNGGSGTTNPGGGSGNGQAPPQLASISPSQVPAGSAAFTLTANGSNFTSQSQIRWNGSGVPTSFTSASELSAQIPAADVANTSTATVTVYTAVGSGLTSNALSFTITSPPPPGVPQLNSISPSQVIAGANALLLTANGANFTPHSVVVWNGNPLPTTFVTANQLTAQISAADIANAGTAAVSVDNPAGSALDSSSLTLTIVSVPDAVAFQINPAHSGAVSLASVGFPPAASWRVALPGPPSYALIADGGVFFTVPGNSTSQLYALSQSTGATLWGPKSIGPEASAVYDAGTVFVSSALSGAAGSLQAFDAGTGNLKWSVTLPVALGYSGTSTAANGYVYMVYGGLVYAYAESNGALVWTASAFDDFADNTVAVTGDGVYLSSPCRTYDWTPATGASLWTNDIVCQGPGGGTAVVANGRIYSSNGFGSLTGGGFGTYGGSILSAETGTLQGLSVADTLPAVDSRNAYFLQSATLRAVSVSTDTVLWTFAGDGLLTSCPIVVNGYVVIGSSSGNLYVLNSTSGAVIWQTNVGGAIPTGPSQGDTLPTSGLSAGDGLLVVPAGNTLTAYSIATPAGQASPPQLAAIDPATVVQGGNAFTLAVTGANFTPQAQILWNGARIPTRFVSASELAASIPATTIAGTGTAQISVSLDGAVSASSTLVIQEATALSLASVTPTSAQIGGAALTLTLSGQGFSTSDVVYWNGSARATAYLSSTELQAQITTADLAAPGAAVITVYDPSGTGRTSTPAAFVVGESLDAVSPQISVSHTGVISFPSVSFPPAASWTVSLPGPPSYALIAAGEVFVTVPVSAGSELFALDQSTGAIRWGPIVIGADASLAYDSATLFVMSATTELGFAEALDPLTGSVQWISPLLGYSFSSGIVASNGLVYATASSGLELFGLSESNGAQVWTATAANAEDSTPAVTETGLYVAYPYRAYDFNPASGATVWAYDAGGDGGGGGMPVVANGLLYWPSGLVFNSIGAPTYGGSIFSADTGAIQGSFAADTPPAISPDTGYFLQSGALKAISASNNTVLWTFNGDGSLATAPIVVNQYVVVGASSGNLYVLNAATGGVVWRVNLGAPLPIGPYYLQSTPLSGLAAGDGLLVVPAGNTLTAYRISP